MAIWFERTVAAPVDDRAFEVSVRTRDAALLATDVYLPARPTRHPTVLVRLPYDKDGRYTFMAAIAPWFTERGYAFVVQDVRGKFRSGGPGIPTIPYVFEIDDAYDTIDWIVSQSWSNGIVGTWGDSYYGWTQWAAVASGHPALKAIVPRVATADAPTNRFAGDWRREVPNLSIVELFATCWLDEHLYAFDIDWSHRPLAEVFDEAFRAAGARSAAVDDLVASPSTTARYDVFRGRHPFETLDIPVLNEGGWFDNIAPQQMHDWVTLSGNPRTAGWQWLSMDSSDHDSYRLDDVPITPETDHERSDAGLERFLSNYLQRGLEFLDVHLQGATDRIPRVRWHLGHVGWREADTWPPPGAEALRLHLTDGGSAGAGADGGGLAHSSDRTPSRAQWVHDPEDLVPSTVANPFAFLAADPDEQEVERRADVMTFTSDPMPTPLDLAGPVTVTVSIESDAPSIPVFVKLVDVTPDADARMLLRGDALIETPDGRPTTIGLGHLGYRISRGHRVRLHVAASDFPLFAWHPGTAENPWTAVRGMPRRIRLGTNEAEPSFLDLTVIRR